MVTNSDIKLFNIVFGDLSELTALQRMDLVEWYFHGSNGKRAAEGDACGGAELERKILLLLSKKPELTVAVIKNRLRDKYTEVDIYGTLEKLKEIGVIKEGYSEYGKAVYSISRSKK